jgi:predicted dehydrogenase
MMDSRPDVQNPPLRLGFAGVGWIGRHRMKCLQQAGYSKAVAIAEPSAEVAQLALGVAPDAALTTSFEAMLDLDLDGIVIATPSAMHAAQAIAALERGFAVFCQKPLGRSAAEVNAVVASARKANRLLGVDLSYRHTSGAQTMRRLVQSGELGTVHFADLTFHNAYGPDKPWFYQRALSGGGCLIDLGVHLVDLALWILGFPEVAAVQGSLFSSGRRLDAHTDTVEDCALATIDLADGRAVRIACSWRLHAGCDAVISAGFYGTQGGAEMRNVAGSFYDFETSLFKSTSRETISAAPEEWGGNAIIDWARRLAAGEEYDPQSEQYCIIADILDSVYVGGCGVDCHPGKRPS